MYETTGAIHFHPSGPARQPPPKSQSEIHLTAVDDDRLQPPITDLVPSLSRLRRILAVFQLCGVNFTMSATSGLVVIALPRLTVDLSLAPSLAFWPSSVQGLATASTLLLAGAVADVMGARLVNMTGCIANGIFMLSCGFVKNGRELVVLRALQGVAIAMHLASSVALVSQTQPRGRGRNVSFACLGLSQLLGFSFGLVVGGVLVDTIGWRFGWYLYGGTTLLLSVVGLWSLPRSMRLGSSRDILDRLRSRVDWMGTLLASAFMASLCYFLAIISTDVRRIKETGSIVLLSVSCIFAPLFIGWMHLQVKRDGPALIPNDFWTNSAFTTVCITTALSFAVLNSIDLLTSLYFQDIQHLSALQAAIRILPSTVVGLALNLATGLVVDRIPAVWLVAVTSLISSGSPLLMALIQPSWSYWICAFFAQILLPFSIDVLYTVGLVIVTQVFPEDRQAVAGAVFNTSAQFGNAMGLAIIQVVSTLVKKRDVNPNSPDAILAGYHASFWTLFSLMLICALVGYIGLRKVGRVGLKHD
ncbi:hypothetical protein ACKLNR_014500 [Fusarium oxysporum f. sp. zingiberi]